MRRRQSALGVGEQLLVELLSRPQARVDDLDVVLREPVIALLTISNIFMTFAWYGHLKYREVPLYKVVVVSWLIAFFEYCFQVPANRIGSYEFSAAQLKTIQEVITLTVFAAFSVLYLRQPLRWNYVAGFVLIVAAVAVIFKKW